ncbi:hypothetical protein ACE6H2_013686 [Prunus campanulata]
MQIDKTVTLIPGLPNDVASLILSFIPYSHQARLKPTSKSRKLFLSSKTLIALRQTHHNLSHLFCIFPQDLSIASPYLFDLQNLAWCPLPPMYCNPHVYGLCNFTSLSIGPHLYVIGGPVKELRKTPSKKHQRFIEFFNVRDAAIDLKEMNGNEINGKLKKLKAPTQD